MDNNNIMNQNQLQMRQMLVRIETMELAMMGQLQLLRDQRNLLVQALEADWNAVVGMMEGGGIPVALSFQASCVRINRLISDIQAIDLSLAQHSASHGLIRTKLIYIALKANELEVTNQQTAGIAQALIEVYGYQGILIVNQNIGQAMIDQIGLALGNNIGFVLFDPNVNNQG